MALTERLRRHIHDTGLAEPGDRLLVAVSGGPDSTALLLALCRIGEGFPFEVAAAHLHHGIRAAADEDERFVVRLCDSLGVPLVRDRVDVPALAREHGRGLEDSARRARYRFLRERAIEVGAGRVALGHTADDQAETVLMNIIRGCGRRGLGGMPPVRPLGHWDGLPDAPRVLLIRPLLRTTRREVEDFLRASDVAACEDESNKSPDFFRNRVRHHLLPLLAEGYNPQVARVLADTAELLRAEDEYLDERARAELGGSEYIAVGQLLGAPAWLGRRLLRLAYEDACPRGELAFDHVEAVLGLCRSEGDGEVSLPVSISAVKTGDVLLFRSGRPPEPAAACVPLPEEGRVEVPELGIAIEVARVDRSEMLLPRDVRGSAHIYLDEEKVSPPLYVRNRLPGDRFRPSGMGGSKSVHDLFIDEKVPRHRRHLVPVVADEGGILWIVGYRLDERAAVGEGTRRVLLVRIAPLTRSSGLHPGA